MSLSHICLSIIFLTVLEPTTCCYLAGTKIVGNDWIYPTPTVVATIGDCQILCQNSNACRFFSHKISTNECYLKFGNSSTQADTNWVSGPKFCGRSLPECIISNKDYGGYNVDLIHPSPTSYDCFTKCQGDSRCMAFTHNNATQWCFKKYGRLVEASDLSGNNCGQKSCDEVRSDCYHYSRAIAGPDAAAMKLGVVSASQCQFLCQNIPKCNFFLYYTDVTHCYFKISISSSVAYIATITGPRTCLTGMNAMKYSPMKRGNPDWMGLIQSLAGQSSITCASTCNAMFLDLSSCTGYAFNKSTGVCDLYVIGAQGFQRFLSNETHSDVIHVREDLIH